MGPFVKGDVVILPFPFSDLSATKRRPALIIVSLPGDDIILCQITSKNRPANQFAIAITNADFVSGGLDMDSNVRPERLFTLESRIIEYRAGVLKPDKMQLVISQVISILNS